MGGWSFLTSPPLVDVMMQIFCLMAVIGWGVYLAAKVVRRRSVFVDSIYPIRCLFLIFFISLGLTWHILQSRAVYGLSYTNSWYTCLALPFTLAFAYGGMSSWGKVIAISWGWLIVSLFVMTEYYGLLAVMLPFYSGGAKWPESLDRLALLHPPWLGPPVFYFSLASSVGLLLIIVVRWYRKYQEETRNSFLRKDHASLAESH